MYANLNHLVKLYHKLYLYCRKKLITTLFICRFVKHKLQSNDKPTIDYFNLLR